MFGTIISVVIAIAVAYVILRIGLSIFRLLATPLPEPPPAGELRKVKLNFRCSTCGSEVRMSVATDEHPDPPRLCMSEMDLLRESD